MWRSFWARFNCRWLLVAHATASHVGVCRHFIYYISYCGKSIAIRQITAWRRNGGAELSHSLCPLIAECTPVVKTFQWPHEITPSIKAYVCNSHKTRWLICVNHTYLFFWGGRTHMRIINYWGESFKFNKSVIVHLWMIFGPFKHGVRWLRPHRVALKITTFTCNLVKITWLFQYLCLSSSNDHFNHLWLFLSWSVVSVQSCFWLS